MSLSEIENQLNDIFNKGSDRKIVMWYDSELKFNESIDDLNLSDNIEVFKLENNNLIYAKFYIEMLHPNQNFLIYAPFSRPSDNDNYLADMANYAESFAADKLSLDMKELNIPVELYNICESFGTFWNAKVRKDAFKNLSIYEFNEKNIFLGILAVLTNEKTINFDYILRNVIIDSFSEKPKIYDSFEKFNVDKKFWEYIYKIYGYKEDNPTIFKLTISLIYNYSAFLFEGDTPKSWDKFLVQDKQNPHVFVDHLMLYEIRNVKPYDNIAKKIQEKIKLESSIRKINVENYINCDSFEIFDENLINHFIDLIVLNKESLDIKDFLVNREKSHFYKKYQYHYELLKWANIFIKLINDFKNDIIPEDSDKIIDIFSNKWVIIDKAYRKFYFNYDKIGFTDSFKSLRQLIENLYANEFLSRLNPAFVKSVSNLNDLEVLKQWNFYKYKVANSFTRHKTAVIISDGLRYGCAKEIEENLNNNPNRSATITPMISSIPSYTALGMASLLPHKEIKFANNKIILDGNSTQSTEDRNKILQLFNPNAIALQYSDIIASTTSELKELFKEKNLIYVYHNQIDARGDNAKSEHEVFNATQETIEELPKLIDILSNYGNFLNIFITADHGFIYRRDKLEESSKVDFDSVNKKYKINRRFLLSGEQTNIESTVSFSLDYINNHDIYVTVPIGADLFKKSGSGLNYVHGGLALQECIVPLIEVKAERGAKHQEVVELQLMYSNKKINNYQTFLTFYQKENISDKVVPLDASIYLVDDKDNKISNEIIIYADVNSDNPEDRLFKEKITLKRIDYSKEKDYYLIIKNNKEDVEILRETFTIDIAFQDDFDF